jgi:hypothetical protein
MNLIRNRTPEERKEENLPEIQGGNHDERRAKEKDPRRKCEGRKWMLD